MGYFFWAVKSKVAVRSAIHSDELILRLTLYPKPSTCSTAPAGRLKRPVAAESCCA